MKRIALPKAATMFTAFAALSYAQSCDRSWQTAKDGSRCGDRAADIRVGER